MTVKRDIRKEQMLIHNCVAALNELALYYDDAKLAGSARYPRKCISYLKWLKQYEG